LDCGHDCKKHDSNFQFLGCEYSKEKKHRSKMWSRVVVAAGLLLHLASAESALDDLDFLLTERVLMQPSQPLTGPFAHER
jgi:hypothetical protein